MIPETPFKGLAPFGDSALDALLFFGREAERETIAANVLASRLTVLYGPSGVGKSSLLRAGVAQALRELDGAAVVVHDAWAEDPSAALAASVRSACDELGPTAGLVDTVAAAAQRHGQAYLLLDQFEDVFLYGGGTLLEELPELLRRRGLRVNVLLALRDDALAELDALAGRMPDVFANLLRLDRLDRRAARAAIVGPLERYAELAGVAVAAEPALVDALLDEVTAGRVHLGGGAPAEEAGGSVEAPFLQLVLGELWAAERAAGSPLLRLETLRELGGAERIVRDHVLGALERLASDEQDLAASILHQLVTPSGGTLSQTAADLAAYAGGDVQPVLDTLARERLLRVVEGVGGGAGRYEIFHDVLAEPFLAWRSRYALAREREGSRRQRRRLLALAAAALVALAVVSAIAVFALTQRAAARTQAREARGQALAAQAAAELPTDPARSVALALRAVGIARSDDAEEVLRRSVLALRERRVVRVGGTAVAAFSPSGSLVVVGGNSGRVDLLRADGSAFTTLPRQRGVTHVAWSGDGQRVATASSDGNVTISAANDGRLVFRDRLSGPVVALSFSGRHLLAAAERRLDHVDPDAGSVTTTRLADPVVTAAASPVAGTYAVATRHGSAIETRIVGAGRSRLLPERGIRSLVFSADGALLATGSADDTARIWDVRTGRLLHVLRHRGHVLAERFSPDGRTLATASADGTVGLWDIRSGVRNLLLVGATGAAEDAAFAPDGKSVVVADADRNARVYDTGDGRILATLAGHRDAVTSVAVSRGGSIATASADGTVRLWDADAGEKLRVIDDRGHASVTAVFDGTDVATTAGREARVLGIDGDLLERIVVAAPITAVAAGSRGLALADAAGDVRLGARTFAGLGVSALASSPGGRLFAGTTDGRVVVLGKRPTAVARVRGRVTALAAAGGQVAVRVAEGTVVVLSQAGRRLSSFRGPIDSMALSPGGAVLATVRGRDATVWNARTGSRMHTLTGHRSAILDVAFSPDGRRLVTAGADRDARIWDVRSGRLVHVLRGHFFAVRTAAYSPDGRWIVTASQFTAGLWDSRTGRLVQYLRGHRLPLTGATFDDRGAFVLTGSEDGTARIVACTVCSDLAGLERTARRRLALLR